MINRLKQRFQIRALISFLSSLFNIQEDKMTLDQALTKALAVCIAILHNFRNLGVAL